MNFVDVDGSFENGKALKTNIMQTIRTAVAESMERRVNDLVDLNATPLPQRTQSMALPLASLARFTRVNVTMTNVPRDEWGAEPWIYIEGCLEAMPDDPDKAPYKQAALDYVSKRLERLAYD